MPRADWDFLKKLQLKVPTETLLEQYQEKFDVIYSEIQALNRMNENLEETKNSFLPRLISGKLSVEDLDIQFPPSMQQESESDTEPGKEAACA